jgi:signal transduction histidine kinase
MEASERERRYWARELHDETLQGLGALRLLLGSALRQGTDEELRKAVGGAIEELQSGIDNLRGLISELRPAALDELGLAAAIDELAERCSTNGGLEVKRQIALADANGAGTKRLSPELESTVYRLVQEALTNVVKHARAQRADVYVAGDDHAVTVEVRDDGVGFDPDVRTPGFGLVGMKERLALAGGSLQISSALGRGTTLRAELPLPEAPAQ